MNYLAQLEANSIYILREAFKNVKPLAMLWSMGKDSNVLLWLVRKAFFGRVPFKVILLDTENEHEEVYKFRDEYVEKWAIDYINASCPPLEETDALLPPNARLASRKTLGLKNVIEAHNFKGILVGIRRDEQPIRGKERFFSPRGFDGKWNFKNQPPEFWNTYNFYAPEGTHLRVHPLLDWTELDIWEYIKQEGIPVVSLYFSKNGKRYRSIGEKDITFPIDSEARTIDEIIMELKTTKQAERSGRSMDNEKEDAFETLRRQGYM
jgi:sulfate adenylyltransferase subunit 2